MRQIKIEQSLTSLSEKSIEQYFVDVNKCKSISPERELELSNLIKQGDNNALKELIEANLRFVISVAKKYQNTGVPLADLINEGNLGLIKAAKKFDGTRGFKFISFAVWWIRQSIIQFIADKKRMIKIPSNKNLEIGKFLNAESILQQNLQREPTEEEICEYMEIDIKNGQILMAANNNYKSLDSKLKGDEDSSTFMDVIQDEEIESPDSYLIDESLQKDIQRAFKILSNKELFIITHTYGIGCKAESKDAIAKMMGYSTESIRQITCKAQKKLARNSYTKKILMKYL
jgi:RNA polymerase primary sigma factor